MSASIREISETMAKSRENFKVATNRVEAADTQAQKLNAAAQAMSGIVEMIAGITGQINLLALNATIESARARAKPAAASPWSPSEVKNLASQAKQRDRHDHVRNRRAEHHLRRRRQLARPRSRPAIAGVNEFIASTAARGRGAEHRDVGHVEQHAARLGGAWRESAFSDLYSHHHREPRRVARG